MRGRVGRIGPAALGVLLALLYLLSPGHPLALLTGVPLGPLSLACTVLVGVLVFAFRPVAQRTGEADGTNPATGVTNNGPAPLRARHSPPVAVVAVALLAVLVVAKLTLAWLAPEYGVRAWYYGNGRFQGSPERSSDFPGESATRRDQELSFGGDEFPVHYLNDSYRFNFFGPEAERRRTQPFSVRWQGNLYVPADGSYRFWLTASGRGTLAIGGQQLAAVDADGRETRTVVLPLGRGSHRLEAGYAKPATRSGDLKVEWDLDGRRQAVARPYLLRRPIAPEAWERERVLESVARAVDGLFLSSLSLMAGWLILNRALLVRKATGARWRLLERPLLGAFLLVVLAHAMLPELDRVDKLSLLGGGQDWLTHETLARDILINGPLMALGKPLGEGRPYYAQPFYPYALAAMHWLTGEALFGPTVLQLFGLGVSGVVLYFLARQLFGTPTAVCTFVVFLGLRTWQLDWVARRLLSENVYFLVLPAALLCLLRYVDHRRLRDLILSGVFLGLAVVTRGPTLLYLPFAAVLVYRGLRGSGRANSVSGVTTDGRDASRPYLGAVGAIMALCLLIVSLVPIRNQIVAGQPALVASSGGVNLEKFHRPTSQVRRAEANRRWYAPYVEDVPTREVLEFILQDPVGYAATFPPLVLYTLGYGAAIDESTIAVWPDLVLLNLLYLAVVVRSRRARTARAGLLHAFVGVHFLTMVVFAPYDYDNRLVLPMYLPIAVFAGFAIWSVVQWAWVRPRPGAAATESVTPRRLAAASSKQAESGASIAGLPGRR